MNALIKICLIFILLVTFSGFVSAEQGLIASYDFENNLVDGSGNGNILKSVGNIKYVDGNMGKGIYLNGDGRSYLQLDSKKISASKGSIEIWASYEGPLENLKSSAYLLSHYAWVNGYAWNKGNPNRFYLTKYGWGSQGNLSVGMGDECDYRSSHLIEKDGIHQYVITWENQKVSAYVDGVRYIDNVAFTGLNTLLPSFTIGTYIDGTHSSEFDDWKGVVDTVRVYDYKISEDKIKEHFNTYKNPIVDPVEPGPTNSTRKFMVMVIVETDDENFTWEDFTDMMDENPEGVYFSEIKESDGLSLKGLFDKIVNYLF